MNTELLLHLLCLLMLPVIHSLSYQSIGCTRISYALLFRYAKEKRTKIKFCSEVKTDLKTCESLVSGSGY